MADLLERIRLAEQVGLDFFGIGEHHRAGLRGVRTRPSCWPRRPAQTSRIGLGSAVTVLSTEDPVRVYQQYATIDLISQGRVELMAGRGSFIESYPLFGADLADYDALYDEKIQLLLQIDAGNPVTWSGQFRPPLDKAVILPRPYPKPGVGEHLRISVATGGNPESSVRAGILGLPVNYAIIGGQPARFAPLVDLYRRAFAQTERPGATCRRSACPGWASSPTTARRSTGSSRTGSRSMRRIARERAVPDARPRLLRGAGRARRRVLHRRPGAGRGARSSPCTAHLRHDRQGFQMDLSSVPQAESLRAIELLGTRVAPLVRAALGAATPDQVTERAPDTPRARRVHRTRTGDLPSNCDQLSAPLPRSVTQTSAAARPSAPRR